MRCQWAWFIDIGFMEASFLPYAVLIFGALATLLCFRILKHHDKYWMAEAIVILSLPIAITFIVFLLVSKVVPDNTKELIAILSAIVGYVFGFVSNKKQS